MLRISLLFDNAFNKVETATSIGFDNTSNLLLFNIN